MKTIITAAVIALGVAAPTFAQTQLESSVGADAGQYTVGELAALKLQASNDGAGERNTFFGNERIQFSANNIHNATAASIFADIVESGRQDN